MNNIKGRYLMPHPPILIDEIGGKDMLSAQSTYDACCELGRRIGDIKPKTIIVITPHGQVFDDALAIYLDEGAQGDMEQFGRKDIRIHKSYDFELSQKLIDGLREEDIYTVCIDRDSADLYDIDFKIDHGTFVPLYFIDKFYRDYKLVQINYGVMNSLKLYKSGMIIDKIVNEIDKDVVVIASGDLSHRLKDEGPYDYHPLGQLFDNEIIQYLERGAVEDIFTMESELINKAGECGMNSIYMLLGTLDEYKINGEILSYEGPFGVGYGVVQLNTSKDCSKFTKLSKAIENKYQVSMGDENELVKFARDTISDFAMTGEIFTPVDGRLKKWQNKSSAVFVSIKKFGELRGCIGSLSPMTDNVIEEISRNSIEAGFHDPRFSPITRSELRDLTISVDILEEPIQIKNVDELDQDVYGVIVKSGDKIGVLLPNLDGVNSIEEQLSIARSKAGIDEGEDISIERFKVTRYT